MAIRINNLRLPIDEPIEHLPLHLSRVLEVPLDELRQWRILRKSLDLRDKRSLQFVFNAQVQLGENEAAVIKRSQRAGNTQIQSYQENTFSIGELGKDPLRYRPIVIGSGPGGLVTAYFLAELGYRPIVLERGTQVSQRIRDVKRFDEGGEFSPESNYLFGEGGAGTFSDGKLTCRNTGSDVDRVLQLFAECKGKQSVIYEHRPHLGSNRLPAVVKAIRHRIEAFGGEVRFQCRVEDFIIQDGAIRGVVTSSGIIPSDVVVLAIGHSARDTVEVLLKRGVTIVQKPFQFGVRIEHPQELVNRIQYGRGLYEQQLGNADYSLIARGNSPVFTFCMCAGGYIIPSVSSEGYFCTNGMSLSRRDSAFANSGLVVTLPTKEFGSDHPLAGFELQKRFEHVAYLLGKGEYRCPVQLANDFLADRKSSKTVSVSYPRQSIGADLREVMPSFIEQSLKEGLPKLDRFWRGAFLKEGVIVGPETRGSCPIRIPRHEDSRESLSIAGIYPVGEGAGYAGGIISAAVDGLRTAKRIIQRFAPLN